ncbi:hypothetical protein EDEG_00597 [Edhazardia aedis USNM 41457]|uniref:Uncharacterized protein n=1 Tax=Edhazardia aedis (strain USNM 41457) TaxID=1003232 RepID=J9DCA0_EDHAE|nr:hypothetical protein EDEG_00597 [Edhazardia aedis USNM 41457]|eukprot:EJW05371.1 hypothetical protein EDEG_00597 [Edhazardia aedis USNM 41457]
MNIFYTPLHHKLINECFGRPEINVEKLSKLIHHIYLKPERLKKIVKYLAKRVLKDYKDADITHQILQILVALYAVFNDCTISIEKHYFQIIFNVIRAVEKEKAGKNPQEEEAESFKSENESILHSDGKDEDAYIADNFLLKKYELFFPIFCNFFFLEGLKTFKSDKYVLKLLKKLYYLLSNTFEFHATKSGNKKNEGKKTDSGYDESEKENSVNSSSQEDFLSREMKDLNIEVPSSPYENDNFFEFSDETSNLREIKEKPQEKAKNSKLDAEKNYEDSSSSACSSSSNEGKQLSAEKHAFYLLILERMLLLKDIFHRHFEFKFHLILKVLLKNTYNPLKRRALVAVLTRTVNVVNVKSFLRIFLNVNDNNLYFTDLGILISNLNEEFLACLLVEINRVLLKNIDSIAEMSVIEEKKLCTVLKNVFQDNLQKQKISNLPCFQAENSSETQKCTEFKDKYFKNFFSHLHTDFDIFRHEKNFKISQNYENKEYMYFMNDRFIKSQKEINPLLGIELPLQKLQNKSRIIIPRVCSPVIVNRKECELSEVADDFSGGKMESYSPNDEIYIQKNVFHGKLNLSTQNSEKNSFNVYTFDKNIFNDTFLDEFYNNKKYKSGFYFFNGRLACLKTREYYV